MKEDKLTQEQIEKLVDKYRGKSKLETTETVNKHLVGENDKLKKELDSLLQVKSASVNTYQIKPQFKKSSEATAIICLSDIHLEEEVKPSTVNYKNKYNLDIARTSVNNFFCNSIKLLKKEQQDINIPELVLFLGGDGITGNIHEENIENALLLPIDASIMLKELYYNGIIYLLNNTKCNITVLCSAGNHSRITKKIRHSSFAGNSLETMVYRWLSDIFISEKRIKFIIEESYHTYINIYDFPVRTHHGHYIKYQGGVGGLTIPVNKAISQWNKERYAYLDIFGHWHQRMYDTGSQAFVSLSSVIGYNAYGISIKASYEDPTMPFILIDKDRGKTGTFPIILR